MFNISKGIKKMGGFFHKLSSNTYASASNNHIDYSELQGCLFSSKKPLDDKWHNGYKSANSEFMWESFNNKLYPGLFTNSTFVTKSKFKNEASKIVKEFNILNTILVNNYAVLDVSRKSVEEEFNKYRASGFNFADQKQSLISNISGNNEDQELKIDNNNIKARMMKLSISGYMSRYSGDEELSNILDETILNKQACIDEMQSMFSINHGWSSGNYDEYESVTIVGVEAA